MPCTAQRIDTLDDLRTYISHTICDHEQLEPDAYAMTEMVLTRRNSMRALLLPARTRATKYSAIWVSDRKTVLFYDSGGERFLTAEFGDADCPELSAA